MAGTLVSIICLLIGGIPFAVVACCLLGLSVIEYKKNMLEKGFTPFYRIIVGVSAAILILGVLNMFEYIPVVILAGVGFSFIGVMLSKREPYIANITVTILGFLIFWMLSYIVFIAEIPTMKAIYNGTTMRAGLLILGFLVAVVVSTDLGAYYFGGKYGVKKLMPDISPNKTIFGAVAGCFYALMAALIVGHYLSFSLLDSFLAGLIVTITAQLGDLSMAVLRKDNGMKYSASMLAGKDGLLDRIGPFLFAAPALYYYFNYFSHYLGM